MAIRPFSKKGQVFSLIAVLMSALFILIFTGGDAINFDEDVKTTETAIKTTNQFVDDLKGFVSEGARASGRMIFHDLLIYHNNSNNFSNFTVSVKDCFLNGSFKENYSDTNGGWKECNLTYENSTFDETMRDIYDVAERTYDINISQHNSSVSVRQTSPYEFRLDVTTVVDARKERGGVGDYGWTKLIDTRVYVSIVGLPDPLSINTDYERNITVHDSIDRLNARTSNIDGDAKELAEFIDNEYFIIDQKAPSFTQMLEGKISPENGDYDKGNNSYGITSYLNGSFYENNRTSMEEYRYKRIDIEPEDLRRINHDSISDNILFEKNSLIQMNFTNSNWLEVEGNCDNSGCW
ncbi:MAG: hypothetical protein ACOCZV_00580 [Nanoarchaeota archaeon]